MPAARFTQAEITRIIRGARKEGVVVEGLALVVTETGETRIETIGAKPEEDTNRKAPHDKPGDW